MQDICRGEFVLESMFGRHLICNDGEFTVTKTDCPYDLSVDGFEVYSPVWSFEYVMPYDKAALGPLVRGFLHLYILMLLTDTKNTREWWFIMNNVNFKSEWKRPYQ